MNNANEQQQGLYGAIGGIDGSDGNFLSNAHEILAAYSAAASGSPSSLLNAYQQGQLTLPGMPQANSATSAFLGGQFPRVNNIHNNPMMAMHLNSMASGGSNAFLSPNNNNLFGLNMMQQQLMLQQQMFQGIQNQRMAQQVANPQFQMNSALLQSLAAGRMLPMSMQTPVAANNASQALLTNNNVMAALQNNNHDIPRRPQLETQLTLPGNYRDFTKEPGALEQEQPTKSGAKDRSFPIKLFQILADEENKEYIAWLPHGRAWKILKQHDFEEKVIPLYFRHAKLASFMRQVNGWGFRRAPAGPDQNAYHHEMFLRGYPQLCAKMRRPLHKVRPQASSNSDRSAQPNFHDSAIFHPLDDKSEDVVTNSALPKPSAALPQPSFPSSDRNPSNPSINHNPTATTTTATATAETVKGRGKKSIATQNTSRSTKREDREESNSDLCASDGDDDASDEDSSDDDYSDD